ncbi:hypothetical protein [Pseudoduganella aquatica]|uniref:hypothetical protein n=1 Tax=Pseudoduganella aquatica TaxID=2660641 RepID=UPI001E653B1C|nr:hypothetical protein [Pseudoduganella aquatica]
MRSKFIGQSVLRRIVGSILSSNLSSREILDISRELTQSPELAFDLSRALRLSMQALDEEPDMHFESIASEAPWLPMLIDRIQRSKIPKKEIIGMLPQRHIDRISPATLQKMSLKDLLLRAFENSSPANINSFIKKIGMGTEPDPYLTGIEKKN